MRVLALATLLLLAPDGGRAALAQAPEALTTPPAAARPSPPRRRPAPRRPARPAPRAAEAGPPAAVTVPAPRSDLAPVPNRAIEAPSVRSEADRPSFSPTLIEPRDLGAGGVNRDRDGRLSREDRLFREPAPGATLRLPFSY